MFHWLRTWLPRPPDPKTAFAANRIALLETWFRTAAASGKPKWLTWVGYQPFGEPHFLHDVALVPVMVHFEPVAGEPLEDVPQACEPRAVVAMFRFTRGQWASDGRAVFNLTVQQVVEQLGKMGEFRNTELPR